MCISTNNLFKKCFFKRQANTKPSTKMQCRARLSVSADDLRRARRSPSSTFFTLQTRASPNLGKPRRASHIFLQKFFIRKQIPLKAIPCQNTRHAPPSAARSAALMHLAAQPCPTSISPVPRRHCLQASATITHRRAELSEVIRGDPRPNLSLSAPRTLPVQTRPRRSSAASRQCPETALETWETFNLIICS